MPQIDPPPVEEVKADEVKKEPRKYNYKRDHEKSIRQIAQESLDAVEEPKIEEPKVETPKEEPKEEVSKPVEPVIDPVKIAEDAATKAAEKTRKELQEELSKIKESDKTLSEKKKAEDELISSWDKEGRLPTDYKEVFNEAQRISEAKMRQTWEAREAERAQKDKEAKDTQERTQRESQEQLNKRTQEIQSRVNEELDELVSSKFLPPSKDGQMSKEAEDLLNFGIKMNTERAAKGEKPVDSLQRIYFMHYKPYLEATGKKPTQVAGADAPVSGSKGSAHSEPPADKYVYARDHNRSFMDIARDGMKRMTGK